MTHEERLSDMPAMLRWFLVAFKQVGFPVLVCAYLAYMHFVEGEKTRIATIELKEVMMALTSSVNQQTKYLKRTGINE